jgi:NAD-dependent deacetylase sirtuin 4
MFGEAVSTLAKDEAEKAVENANRVLVVGSSLATYSAWRLVKSAVGAGSSIGILNLGGVRGEESLVSDGALEVRIEQDLQTVLPAVADAMERQNSQ